MKSLNSFNFRNYLVVISLFYSVSCTSEKSKSTKIEQKTLLIIAQRPTPSGYPAVIVNNIATIESYPFDGMFINSVVGWHIMSGKPISYDSIYHEFKMLKGVFKKFDSNFLYVFTDFPGDFWDDNAWKITANNFANMAKVAKELNFKGLIYDNEEYLKGKWMNYGESYKNPKYDLNQHRDQVILRGKQIMEAMVAVFPEVEIFTYHGPYLSEPNYKIPSVNIKQAGAWDQQELLGPFFVGMMQGKGTKATIIDGGEQYQYRTNDEFKNSYDMRKYEIASEETNSWFIPYKQRLDWPNNINISFGVYNRPWLPDYPMNVQIMQKTLTNALNNTDKYVWYYTEYDSWLEPNKMPKEWVDMVINARRAVK